MVIEYCYFNWSGVSECDLRIEDLYRCARTVEAISDAFVLTCHSWCTRMALLCDGP